MTQVLLIRHATNDYVDSNRLAGWTPGVHLNEAGRKEAEALAQRLAPVPLAAIFSSPLERAVETAEAIARPRGLRVEVREALGEVQYGEWTGQLLEDLAKTELWRFVQFHPSGVRFPGGEAIREMQARAVAAVEAICEAFPEDAVAIVSHADVIKAIAAYFVGLHLDLFQRLVIAPASVTALHLGKMEPRLVCLSEVGSLEYLVPRPQEHKSGADGNPPVGTAIQPPSQLSGRSEPVTTEPDGKGG